MRLENENIQDLAGLQVQVTVMVTYGIISLGKKLKLGLQYDADDVREKTPSRCQNADVGAVHHLQFHLKCVRDEPLRACSSGSSMNAKVYDLVFIS